MIYKILLTAYIAYTSGLTVALVGTFPEDCNEPYSWWLVPLMFAFAFSPALLGYFAGYEDGKKKTDKESS